MEQSPGRRKDACGNPIAPRLIGHSLAAIDMLLAGAGLGVDRMWKLLNGLMLAGCLASLSACASTLAGGDLIRPGEPTGVIIVVNETSGYVDAVSISDCDNFTYGLNRLPDGYSIPPGGSYQFTVSAGCWDVDAGSFENGEARQRMQVEAFGGVEYTVTD
jgi:hypothetical protein